MTDVATPTKRCIRCGTALQHEPDGLRASNCDPDHVLIHKRSHHVSMPIDLDFDLMTVDGDVFRSRQLLGRPTILVLLRYLGDSFAWSRRGLFAIAPPRAVWGYIRFALQGKIWHPEQLDLAQMGGDFIFDRDGELTLSHLSSRSDDRPSVPAVMSAFRRAAAKSADAAGSWVGKFASPGVLCKRWPRLRSKRYASTVPGPGYSRLKHGMPAP